MNEKRRKPLEASKDDLKIPEIQDFEQRQYKGDPIFVGGKRHPEPPRDRMFPKSEPRELRQSSGIEMEAIKQILSKLDIIESRLKIIEGKIDSRQY